jgi:hypothetical protein
MSKDITGKPTSTERAKYLHSHLQGMMLIPPLLAPNQHNMNLSHSPTHTHTHTHTHTGICPSLRPDLNAAFIYSPTNSDCTNAVKE